MSNVITNERKGLGWIKDQPDFRDHIGRAHLGQQLPPVVDMRDIAPPIVDQSRTNSCVGNGSASLFRFMRRRLRLEPDFQPSRSFIYWLARHVPRKGWENEDMGAMPRDAMQSLISNGVVPEDQWPFDEDKINERPLQGLLHEAKEYKVVEGEYVRMKADDNLYHLKHSLALGLPFLIGIGVYSSFFNADTNGMVPMPKTSESYEGGHLMYCVGYSDPDRIFICPNSWGEEYGDHGVYYLPFEYVEEPALADDFWRIEAVTK